MMLLELFKYSRVPKQNAMHPYGGFSREPLFAEDLCKMFNRSFYDGVGVPNSWLKSSYLIPMYIGKGSQFDTDNYRGVAPQQLRFVLLCTRTILEYSKNRLDDFCEKHGLRVVTQCGFLTVPFLHFLLCRMLYKKPIPAKHKGDSTHHSMFCFVD
jgi:hypothetical protein